MAVQLSQHAVTSAGDLDFGAIACDKWLYRISPMETILTVDAIDAYDVTVVSGVWTAAAIATEVAFSNAAPSTAVLTMFNRDVAIGKAIQFAISGQTVGKDYLIRYTVTTSSGRTVTRDVKLSVAD
jgi:hypothetical protein